MQGPALYVIVQSQAIFYVTGSRWNLHFAFSLGPFTQLYDNHSGQILQYRCNINKKATVLIYWSLIPRWPCGWKAWKKILFLALIIFIIILYFFIFHFLPLIIFLIKQFCQKRLFLTSWLFQCRQTQHQQLFHQRLKTKHWFLSIL